MENFLLTLSGNYLIQLPGDPCSGVDMCPFNLMFILAKTAVIFIILSITINYLKTSSAKRKRERKRKMKELEKAKEEKLLANAMESDE